MGYFEILIDNELDQKILKFLEILYFIYKLVFRKINQLNFLELYCL